MLEKVFLHSKTGRRENLMCPFWYFLSSELLLMFSHLRRADGNPKRNPNSDANRDIVHGYTNPGAYRDANGNPDCQRIVWFGVVPFV